MNGNYSLCLFRMVSLILICRSWTTISFINPHSVNTVPHPFYFSFSFEMAISLVPGLHYEHVAIVTILRFCNYYSLSEGERQKKKTIFRSEKRMFTPKKFTETAKDCKTCKTFFLSSLTVGQNKLECFFLPSFRIVCNLWVRLYPWQALMLFDQMQQTWPTKNFPGTLHLILTKNQWQKKFCYVCTLTFLLPQLATIYAAFSKLACSFKKTFWTS